MDKRGDWVSNMIRYLCSKCEEKFIGGAEDTECPLCGGRLMFKEIVDHD